MVVARHGRIVGADIFCNAAVFREHRDRLLDSYALDCYVRGEESGRPHRRRPDVDDAERFLRQTLRAQYSWHDTPGQGRMLSVHAPGLSGSALVLHGAALHAALFPRDAVIIRPMPTPQPRRIPRLEP